MDCDGVFICTVLLQHDDHHGFVQHGDGFTMHWPGDTASMASMASMLRAVGGPQLHCIVCSF